MDRRRCVVCRVNRSSHPNRKFFCFPKDPTMSKLWVEACLNLSNLVGKTPEQLYVSSYRVCSEHFSEKDYASSKMHRLTATACPKVDLDVFSYKVAITQKMLESAKRKNNLFNYEDNVSAKCLKTTGALSADTSTNGVSTAGTLNDDASTNGVSSAGPSTTGTLTDDASTDGISTADPSTAGTLTDDASTDGISTAGTLTDDISPAGTLTDDASTNGVSTAGPSTTGTLTDDASTAGTLTDDASANGVSRNSASTAGTITDDASTAGTLTNGVSSTSTSTAGTLTNGVSSTSASTAGTITDDASTAGTLTNDAFTADAPSASTSTVNISTDNIKNASGSGIIITSIAGFSNAVPPKSTTSLQKLRTNLVSANTKIRALNGKVQYIKKKSVASKLSNILLPIKQYVSSNVYKFIESQVKNFFTSRRGRRWSLEDKNLALKLYRASPRAYKALSKHFCFPSLKTVRKNLSRISLETEFSSTDPKIYCYLML